MVSFIIFIVLLFLTVGGIPIIVTKVKSKLTVTKNMSTISCAFYVEESNCSETSNPRHTLVNYGKKMY